AETPATNPPTTAPTDPPTPAPNEPPGVIGRSVNGTAIGAVRFGIGPNPVIVVGGIHAGYAPASVTVLGDAIHYFGTNPDAVPESVSLFFIDELNPDSERAVRQVAGRLNANGVDLNRNFGCNWAANAMVLNQEVAGAGGSAPISEPESAALAKFIEDIQPKAVIVLGAAVPGGRVTAGLCEGGSAVSADLATTFGAATGYQTFDNRNEAGTTLTGDVTDWLDSKGIPAIFILLPHHVDSDWPAIKAGIEAVMKVQE
ncbi:MAG TPA: hypothetical protein ENJ56_02665, partial [Anaerolineae bacterium]|nr:hypothetical protein [Anaerolineae bacterium]